MKGAFKSEEDCIKELRNQGFIFYSILNGFKYFVNSFKSEIAEINIYSDGSASALLGKYNTQILA